MAHFGALSQGGRNKKRILDIRLKRFFGAVMKKILPGQKRRSAFTFARIFQSANSLA
jgi:hypothetical protein